MNERIKELAREAGLLVHNPTGVPTKLDKFAELIVNECASLCEVRAWGMIEKGFPGHEAVEECSDIIKQHFGVE